MIASCRRTSVFLVPTLAILSVGFGGGTAATAELVVRDAFLMFEILPSDFHFDIADATGSRTGDDKFESNYGMAVTGLYSFAGPGDSHGFLVGGQLSVAQAGFSSIGHYTAFGIYGEGGYGWAINDRWTLKGLIEIGYGKATLDVVGNSAFSAFSASGPVISYGGRIGTTFTINDQFLVNADVGYLTSTAKLSGSDVDVTLANSGFLFALGVSYRFSASPRPLE